MSVAIAKSFLTSATADKVVAQKLLAIPAGDTAGFLNVAKSAGYNFSKEDWYTASVELNGGDDVTGQTGEMSIDDLLSRSTAFGVRG